MKKSTAKVSGKDKPVKAKPAVQPQPVKPAPTRARAVVKFLRISPRKVRRVIDVIRRQPALKAASQLSLMNKKAARMAHKLLTSALANAKVLGLDENRLYVADVRADGGPVLKRFLPRSMGRADRLLKRTTHLSIELREGEKVWRSAQQDTAVAMEEQGKPKAKAKLGSRKKAAKAGA